jgi:hypothetical protein
MKEEIKDKCCEVCRTSNGVCYGCSCHTPQGRAIKDNLESMNNNVLGIYNLETAQKMTGGIPADENICFNCGINKSFCFDCDNL